MIVEYADHREVIDFVVPTKAEGLALIADGATNKLDLLEQAGMSKAEAKAEIARIEAAS